MPSSSQYKQIAARIKSRVMSAKFLSEANLKEMEQTQLKQNGRLPTETPGTHYYTILKNRNLAVAILRNM
jgi:hypothetical protein